MGTASILFLDAQPEEGQDTPDFFPDLNLGYVIDAITTGFDEYRLTSFFHLPLQEVDAVFYRQEVFRDLENPDTLTEFRVFAQEMREVRAVLERSRKATYGLEKARRILDGASMYCAAIHFLAQRLRRIRVTSRALRGFWQGLSEYISGPAFHSLSSTTNGLERDLASIEYDLVIDEGKIIVSERQPGLDYSKDLEAKFDRFRRGAVRDYRVEYADEDGFNHIEAAILDRVALLFPGPFQALTDFATKHEEFIDDMVARFDREMQFYLAYRAFADGMQKTGLHFCYPTVSTTAKEVECRGAFDIALAHKLAGDGTAVVTNDVSLHGRERTLVVTGPNQGGKSTFARMVGQLHFLASLGCPVPGTEARLLLCDRMFTHFEKEETVANLRGKLQDDLIRVREILDRMTPRSLVIMNEVFSSTSLQDALYLSREIMGRLSALDAITVWVTFLAELASFDEKTVSVVGQLEGDDPSRRSFRVERRPARGQAYSVALAEKHRVTYRALKERLAS